MVEGPILCVAAAAAPPKSPVENGSRKLPTPAGRPPFRQIPVPDTAHARSLGRERMAIFVASVPLIQPRFEPFCAKTVVNEAFWHKGASTFSVCKAPSPLYVALT